MNDVITRLEPLPCGMKALTLLDDNNDYNIYLNANLSYAQQLKAYNHELVHINRNDFCNDLDIKAAEDI